ncbi:MAG TPA: alpha/beta hydrolase-fold protein [Streptosporangiaceae bacterium]|nr:alpha/beta hydrolase-fold protein [Streptosporangiaceae bacterium]
MPEFPPRCPPIVPPAWLNVLVPPGHGQAFDVPTPDLGDGAVVGVRTWSPPGVTDGQPLPLLVVHDGPEYDLRAALTRYLAAGVAGAWLPPLRAALLAPGHRDQWYSAHPAYARTLARVVLPAVTGRLASTARIGMGASLGALAMLHAHVRHPGTFGALFLQSGSYFTLQYDRMEEGFRYFRRIVRFVAAAPPARAGTRPVPAVLTCGTSEENLPNNQLMAQALADAGYPAELHEVRGGHDWPTWRDSLDPYLTGLLRRTAG